MESTSSEQRELARAILSQIDTAISDILEWNKDIKTADDYLITSDGMRTLAATSMLLEAIGEGFKRIDKITKGTLLAQCPEIPWRQVKGLRDHIAHGYFDIDTDIIWDTVSTELSALQEAVRKLQAVG